MHERPPVPVERSAGLIAPVAALFGLLAIVGLVVARLGQTEDWALDLYAGLIALAVGLTVFSGLWWIVTSGLLRDLAAWWDADHPAAHVDAPVLGGTGIATLAYVFFYGWLEERIGAFGLVFALCVLQLAVTTVVARHLARRLDRDVTDTQAADKLKDALLVTGGPLVAWILSWAVMTRVFRVPVAATMPDMLFTLAIGVPFLLVALYVGFAIVYGAGDAVARTWTVLTRRSE